MSAPPHRPAPPFHRPRSWVSWIAVAAAGAAAACGEPAGIPLTPHRVTPATGPLAQSTRNPRYFADTSGRIVYLAGSHTWGNLQDNGRPDPPAPFDYTAYLDSLETWNHNFFRLWVWEQATWTAEIEGNYSITPVAFQRTGPDTARDGKARFDLTRFNPEFFRRLRNRVMEAGRRGFYVSVMLFDGWSVDDKDHEIGNPWLGHPMHRDNNVNGIDGDPDDDGEGHEVHTLALPPVTAIQEAYVRQVIDAVNDLDNVLYEISNESPGGSAAWQHRMIRFVRRYEATKARQHPVGMTVEYHDGINDVLFASPADWISPNGEGGYRDDPPAAQGAKVIIADTDHFCPQCAEPVWVWKAFLRGLNPIFMDPYDGRAIGLGAAGFERDDGRWGAVRRNLGYTLTYAHRMDLSVMRPRGDLASTGYSLVADRPVPEVLALAPQGGSFTVALWITGDSLAVEWFRPETGEVIPDDPVAGGRTVRFRPPFRGPAVLHLRRTD